MSQVAGLSPATHTARNNVPCCGLSICRRFLNTRALDGLRVLPGLPPLHLPSGTPIFDAGDRLGAAQGALPRLLKAQRSTFSA